MEFWLDIKILIILINLSFCTPNYASNVYPTENDEDKVLDMDDLFRMGISPQLTTRMQRSFDNANKLPPNKLNHMKEYTNGNSFISSVKSILNKEKFHTPSHYENENDNSKNYNSRNQWKIGEYLASNNRYKKKFSGGKLLKFNQIHKETNADEKINNNDVKIKEKSEKTKNQERDEMEMLENLVLHPTWLTMQVENNNDNDKSLKINSKEYSPISDIKKSNPDIDNLNRLQKAIKSKIIKKTSDKIKYNSKTNDGNPINNMNVVRQKTFIPTQIDNPKLNNFEEENKKVVKALNDFYRRLFDSLTQAVPSLRFEDPFILNYQSKTPPVVPTRTQNYFKINLPEINKNLSSLLPTKIDTDKDNNKNNLGQFIEKKLEYLKKYPELKRQRFPTITLAKMLDNFPNLFITDHPDEYLKKQINFIDKLKKTNEIPTILEDDQKSLLSIIPELKYTLLNDLTNDKNSKNTNENLTAVNFSKNLENVTPFKTILPVTTYILSGSKLKENLGNTLKILPGIDKIFHRADMRKRIEWENEDSEKMSSIKQSDNFETSNITSKINNENNPQKICINANNVPLWIKDPDHGKMVKYVFKTDTDSGKKVLTPQNVFLSSIIENEKKITK